MELLRLTMRLSQHAANVDDRTLVYELGEAYKDATKLCSRQTGGLQPNPVVPPLTTAADYTETLARSRVLVREIAPVSSEFASRYAFRLDSTLKWLGGQRPV